MSKTNDKATPETEEVEPVAFSNKSGGNRTHLLCKIGESFDECVKRHASSGWSVDSNNAVEKEHGKDAIKLVFKQP
jgi:hypothetical protein